MFFVLLLFSASVQTWIHQSRDGQSDPNPGAGVSEIVSKKLPAATSHAAESEENRGKLVFVFACLLKSRTFSSDLLGSSPLVKSAAVGVKDLGSVPVVPFSSLANSVQGLIFFIFVSV